MAQIRATFFFKDDNDYGWTETIHNNAGDLRTAMVKAQALVPVRTACMGLTASLVYIRVSDDLVKRDSLVFQVPVANSRNKPFDAGDSDIANTCLLIRLEASALIRRSLYMRGIPDNVVVKSGQFVATPGFQQALVQWGAKLVLDGWSIRSKDPLSPTVAINNVVQVPATGVVTITTGAPHLLALPAIATIRGVRGSVEVDGSWQVLGIIDATNFTIQLHQLIRPWTGGGSVSKNQYLITGINNVIAVRASHRISGRPFDSPRGRRKARTRR
jgi:hypothetical protein